MTQDATEAEILGQNRERMRQQCKTRAVIRVIPVENAGLLCPRGPGSLAGYRGCSKTSLAHKYPATVRQEEVGSMLALLRSTSSARGPSSCAHTEQLLLHRANVNSSGSPLASGWETLKQPPHAPVLEAQEEPPRIACFRQRHGTSFFSRGFWRQAAE